MKNNLGQHFENLSDDTKKYLKSLLAYYKLDLLKKSALALATAGNLFIRTAVLLLILLFISIGLAFLIGEEIQSIAGGFFMIGGFYILILIITLVTGKKLVEKPVLVLLNKILNVNDKILGDDDDDEKSDA
ncbi:MAG: hypothetical protein ABR595_02710 [Psychroflexus sp.]